MKDSKIGAESSNGGLVTTPGPNNNTTNNNSNNPNVDSVAGNTTTTPTTTKANANTTNTSTTNANTTTSNGNTTNTTTTNANTTNTTTTTASVATNSSVQQTNNSGTAPSSAPPTTISTMPLPTPPASSSSGPAPAISNSSVVTTPSSLSAAPNNGAAAHTNSNNSKNVNNSVVTAATGNTNVDGAGKISDTSTASTAPTPPPTSHPPPSTSTTTDGSSKVEKKPTDSASLRKSLTNRFNFFTRSKEILGLGFPSSHGTSDPKGRAGNSDKINGGKEEGGDKSSGVGPKQDSTPPNVSSGAGVTSTPPNEVKNKDKEKEGTAKDPQILKEEEKQKERSKSREDDEAEEENRKRKKREQVEEEKKNMKKEKKREEEEKRKKKDEEKQPKKKKVEEKEREKASTKDERGSNNHHHHKQEETRILMIDENQGINSKTLPTNGSDSGAGGVIKSSGASAGRDADADAGVESSVISSSSKSSSNNRSRSRFEHIKRGVWPRRNKDKDMDVEAGKKVKNTESIPTPAVVQWSPTSFRPRTMRSGVYIVNDPRFNRTDSSPYTSNCSQVQLKKMQGGNPDDDILGDSSAGTGSIYRSALTKLVCCLYALIIIALGLVFFVASALTSKERHHSYYLEVFLVYLYVMSLLILLYFHVHLLRGMKNTYFEKNLRITIRRSQDNLHKSNQTEPISDDNDDQVLSDHIPNKNCNPDEMSTSSQTISQSHLELPTEGTAAHVGEGINFYLRLGCLAFSLGSVALDGFHLATYFETEATATCESPIFPLVYVMHLLFVFVQTFFVFKNHKLVINKSKALVRFGLMHLLATNLCVWSSTAIAETAKDYRQQTYFKNAEQQAMFATVKPMVNATKSCFEDVTLARAASPYLFPCTIMYSLIASGIIHRMYLYVGVKVQQKWPSHMSLTSSQPQSTASMDCEKANRGLFLGLLIGVITLIAIATFFVFEVRISDSTTAIKVFFITEIALLLITSIGVILGYIRLSSLKFRGSRMISLDSILLIIALSGAYVYLFLVLISSATGLQEFGVVAILSLICISMELVQLSLQAVFLLDGLCRSIKYEEQQTRKPGRAIVTFLLVCNLALWAVSSFEVKKTKVVPLHESFYGLLAWNIIIHMCLPLLIFIRFHSVICLSEIWYDAYQKDKDN